VASVICLSGDSGHKAMLIDELKRVLPVEHRTAIFHEGRRCPKSTRTDRLKPAMLSAKNHAAVEGWCGRELREHRRQLIAFLLRVIGVIREAIAGRTGFADKSTIGCADGKLVAELPIQSQRVGCAREIIIRTIVLCAATNGGKIIC